MKAPVARRLAAGATGRARRPTDPAPTTLTVFAAASLTEAFQELGRTLEARAPGLAVQFSFAGSQQLALQLEQGAPADVFASADQRWMEYAEEKGLVDGRAHGVRAEPAGGDRAAHQPGAHRAAAGPRPAGHQAGDRRRGGAGGQVHPGGAAEAGRAPGFPPEYDRRVLANVVSQEENVKRVVGKVQLGEADAGVVYRSDVTPAVSRYVRESSRSPTRPT